MSHFLLIRSELYIYIYILYIYIYIWSKNFSHSTNVKSEAKDGGD